MWDWLFVYAPLIALGLSFFAFIASFFSLGWNVYRDIVLKPRLRVEFGIKWIMQAGEDERLQQSGPPLLILSGINHGPGEVVCRGAVARTGSFIRSLFREFPYGFIVPDHANPYCSKLPTRLAVGDEVSVVFPYDRECFLVKPPNRIGITDSFGRTHWASKKGLKLANRQYRKDFGDSAEHDRQQA